MRGFWGQCGRMQWRDREATVTATDGGPGTGGTSRRPGGIVGDFWRSAGITSRPVAACLVLGVAIMGVPVAAGAADWAVASRFAPQRSADSYGWGGGYFGVNVGHSHGRVTGTPGNPAGVGGGIQGGYNWQFGQFVVGGETDLQVSGARDTFASWQFSNPWFGSVRARAGFAMNNILFYATAGLAYAGVDLEFGGVTESRRHLGFTTGAGMEVGLARNWSARAEYLFNDLTDRAYVLTDGSNGFEANTLRVGVNYRF